ncbi:hypothetical protein EDB84DRAFT_1438202 [Lactarius hengduanensis]|nr:hypothetical protein EDB84DRAFT_1438311 [Lactarius hengduanensis]KAH9034167.1 hypothetical protein EDB84DRAFT_1438202 [Lactarius hengduanensis]
MNRSQVNSLEYQRQAIDVEIKSLEGSIRVLRLRCNALVPVSSLPPEVIATIFSFVRLRASTTMTIGGNPGLLAWLHVAHVCHRWREIALNQASFWSHVDFTTLTSAGAAEILARAKKAPLHLEARVPIGLWDGARFNAFEKELHSRISHVCRLAISAENFRLRKILGRITSPAPTLEYLSLSNEKRQHRALPFIPDNIFGGITPRLSCLELCNCNINWTSPLLKGLKNLQIFTLSANMRPSLEIWLDVLDEMPQLEMLILHSATPTAPPFPYDVKRTVTLPFLTHLDISATARDCALALAHLKSPALTWLYVAWTSLRWDFGDIQEILPHLARHAYGPQDTQPLQSMLIRGDKTRADIFAWTVPDIDREVRDPITLLAATLHARVILSITSKDRFLSETHTVILDEAMATLPLDSLVTLTVQNPTRLEERVWRRHALRWPLLQRVRLPPPAAHGFREMLLNDDGGRECPLLPSLAKLDLVNTRLSARRTLCLCDALMKRVEQGVPLETLDLRTCVGTPRAVQLLGEIVVDVSGPEEDFWTRVPPLFMTDLVARGCFVLDDDSGAEDYLDNDDNDAPNTSSDHVDEDGEEIDDEEV